MSAPKKDCQRCRSRRIKCDRTLPTCLKCASRSMECPGYSRVIRFIIQTSQNRLRSQNRSRDGRLRGKPSTTGEDIAGCELSTELKIKKRDYAEESVPRNPSQLSLFFQESNRSSPGQKPMARSRLFHHFTNSIAAQLVWVDNSQNPWREFICPLAAKSPCIFYAVLAIAAANLHVNFDEESPFKLLSLELSQNYRQKTMFLLAHHMNLARRPRAEKIMEAVHIQSFKESLAATLLLWHLEMHFPSDSIWKLHLRAAQALIHGYGQTPMLFRKADRCGEFLLSEFYCATVWPRLTLNIDLDDNMAIGAPFQSKSDEFIGFVQLMHQIILQAPWSSSITRKKIPESFMTIAQLESQATKIRQKLLKFQCNLDSYLPREKSADVVHVIDAWFYAILIFGYRVIGTSNESKGTIESDCDCLFEALACLSNPLSFPQNQPWPLFIAGTECAGDEDRQDWVESRLQALIKLVCPLDRPRMLDFLREWWGRSDEMSDRHDCWIEFRRETNFSSEFIIW